ncbi:phenylacetate--CoA ligase family protein [Kocuria salsicia]|uniref:phenylacetate--CoA ligase family protein n=1 Tax=Kocuria salsicia TaxID=664639 RepID=UPI0011A4282F|nr:phenylacetate--CoA ligase family protein [Kocuria salsicia]
MIPLENAGLWEAANEFAAAQKRQWSGEMSAEALDAWQATNLQKTIEYCQDKSPFYQRHLAGLEATSPIDALPFTAKDDLRQHLDDVASLSLDHAWVYYETTGTTGVSTPCPRTAEDSIRTGVALCEGYRDLLNGHGEHLSIAVMGPTELHSTGDTFGDVFRSLGHSSIKMWPHSPVVGFERASHLLQRLPITGLTCTPGMTILLARHLLASGIDPSSLGVRVILTVGELATPQLLEQIGKVWNADVYSCMYASQEASILAVCQSDGRLRTTPLNYYYEIIDPDTGLVLNPTSEEREGELVVTHLYRGAKPLIRYRTGDLIRAQGAGQDFTITPIGRARDELHIGNAVYAAHDFEATILQGCPAFLDYQVDIHRRRDHDEVDLLLEPRHTPSAEDHELAERHAETLAHDLGVPIHVLWGKTDAQTSTGAMVSWKAARIRDHRENKPGVETDSAAQIATQRESRTTS